MSVDGRLHPRHLKPRAGRSGGRMMASVTFIAGARPKLVTFTADQILTGLQMGDPTATARSASCGTSRQAGSYPCCTARRWPSSHPAGGRIGAGADFRLVTLTDR